MIENFGDKGNTAGFKDNPENINRKGAPEGKRITTILKHILDNDMAKVREDLKGKNGNEVTAIELLKIALSRDAKDSDKLSALKEIMDRVDGKPTQPVDISDNRQSQETFLEQFNDKPEKE